MAQFRLPPLNSLRAFEAAARHQSIKLACAELHVNHSSVSRHIRKVEQYLGRRLFERGNRQLVLTDAGKTLHGAVTMGFSLIQFAFMQLSRKQRPEKLVIAVDPDFAGLWLVPRLGEFYSLVPNTLVEILAERSVPDLRDPRISCAIHYGEAGRNPEIGEMLFRSRLFPVCARELILQAPLQSPNDLGHYPLLHDRSVTEWGEYLRSCGATVDLNVTTGIIFSKTALCLDAAVRGQGVALGDDFLAAIHLSEGRLVKPFKSAVLSKNAYYFLVSEENSASPVVKAFRAWLLRSIQSMSAQSR
jgi:LysR family transcriptional regulator, glycine cleavage system transcriptional activator